MTKPNLVKLYTDRAIECDAKFGQALRDCGQDRWTTPSSEWPESVKEAYKAKVQADEHMHQSWELWRK